MTHQHHSLFHQVTPGLTIASLPVSHNSLQLRDSLHRFLQQDLHLLQGAPQTLLLLLFLGCLCLQ